jgi:competence protein ComEA
MTAVLLVLVFAQLPDGPGKAETTHLCSECHEIERATSVRQDSAGWQETVNKMTSLGMTGTDAEIRTVLGYLTKSFPADAIPKLNVNTALQIELESVLDLRRSQAAAVIEFRTKNGKFHSMEDLKKVPGLDGAKLDAKKDRVTF